MIRRTVKITLEILAALVTVVVILGGYGLWRVTSSPIRIEYLTPYIEQMLSDPANNVTAKVAGTVFAWDNETQEFRFIVTDAKLYDAAHKIVADMPELSVDLRFFALFGGKIAPGQIHVERPHIWMDRLADGKLVFGPMTEDAPAAPETGPDTAHVDFVTFIQQTLGIKSGGILAFRMLSALEVDEAIATVRDRETGKIWEVTLPHINLSRDDEDLFGSAQIGISQGEGMGVATVNFVHMADDKKLKLTARFDNLNLAFLGDKHPKLSELTRADLPLGGEIGVTLTDELALADSHARIQGGAGKLTIPELYAEPLAVTSLDFDGRYDAASRTLTVQQAAIETTDGPKLSAALATTPQDGDGDGDGHFAFNGTFALTDAAMDKLGRLWPVSVAPNPREWVTANMKGGSFTKMEARITGNGNWRDLSDLAVTDVKGSLAAEGATIHYFDPLPPITEATAKAEYDQNSMRVQVINGQVNGLKLLPSPVVIEGLSAVDQSIAITVNAQGTVADVLRLIDHEPLAYAQKVGLNPALVSGQAETSVNFTFPLLKDLPMEKVAIKGKAKVKAFASNDLISRAKISQGELTLDLDAEKFVASGKAALNGVPMDVRWTENFSVPEGGTKPRSVAEVSGLIDAAQVKTFGVDLDAYARGQLAMHLIYSVPVKGDDKMSVEADATQAMVHYDDLAWRKPAGTPLAVKTELVFQKGATTKMPLLKLDGPQVKIVGAAEIDPQGGFRSIDLKTLVLGRTDGRATYTAPQHGMPQKLDVAGASFEYVQTPAAPDGTVPPPSSLDLKINVGKLYTGPNSFFTDVVGTAQRDAYGWSAIDLKAKAEGTTPVVIWLRPEGKISRLSIVADDFGAVLRAWDATQAVRGGALQVEGVGKPDAPRLISGTVKMGSYRVRDLPFLAMLINAISIAGLPDLLQGDGIGFDKLEGKFTLDGYRLWLQEVSTSGTSLGLNIDGAINMTDNHTALRGTVVPFDFVNRILSNIPLLGDLLTGGANQGILAVSYSARGPLDKLDVSVNPVSALTPGLLRQIFFLDNDGPPEPPKDTPSQTP